MAPDGAPPVAAVEYRSPTMLKVRDIMTTEVFTVDAHEPIVQAAWTLTSQLITGAPVKDGDGNVIGVLSETDLLRRFLDERGNPTGTVSSAISGVVWSIAPDDPAIDAVRLMTSRRIHRVVVIEAPGKLVGIVSSTDVLAALDKGLSFQDPDPEPAR